MSFIDNAFLGFVAFILIPLDDMWDAGVRGVLLDAGSLEPKQILLQALLASLQAPTNGR